MDQVESFWLEIWEGFGPRVFETARGRFFPYRYDQLLRTSQCDVEENDRFAFPGPRHGYACGSHYRRSRMVKSLE